MINSESLKLQLVQDIIRLPDDKLTTVRDFLDRLTTDNGREATNGAKGSRTPKVPKPNPAKLRPEDNPMLKFIGLADYDPPAKSIDEELYGEDPL